MDEYSTGMDPEVKSYFKKIMKTFSVGLLWMMVVGTAGFFFGLAIIRGSLRWYNIVFYSLFLLTLFAIILFFYKVWRKND